MVNVACEFACTVTMRSSDGRKGSRWLFLRILLRTHQVHTPRHAWARALSITDEQMKGQMAIVIAFLDLTILDVRWPLFFFWWLIFSSMQFSAFSEKMKKIYWQEVWIFCKMHDGIAFFLVLRSSVRRFQMPFEGLSFVKTLVKFGIITQRTHCYKIRRRSVVCLRWLTFDQS